MWLLKRISWLYKLYKPIYFKLLMVDLINVGPHPKFLMDTTE